jgi:hypothetical protein
MSCPSLRCAKDFLPVPSRAEFGHGHARVRAKIAVRLRRDFAARKAKSSGGASTVMRSCMQACIQECHKRVCAFLINLETFACDRRRGRFVCAKPAEGHNLAESYLILCEKKHFKLQAHTFEARFAHGTSIQPRNSPPNLFSVTAHAIRRRSMMKNARAASTPSIAKMRYLITQKLE